MASHDLDFPGVAPDNPPGTVAAEPRRRGCLFYGCVVVVVLAVLLMLGLALAAWVGYRTAVRYRDMYTSDRPIELPRLKTSQRDRERAAARVEKFRDAVESGQRVDPLILSGDDLNALIQESPSLKDRVHLVIDDDKIQAMVSLPLDELQDFSLTRGRYLNGEAEVKLELSDGKLDLEVVSMRAEGKDLPSAVCDIACDILRDILRRADPALDQDDDTEEQRRVKRFMRRIDSLKVDDGEIVVKPRLPD